MDYKDSKVYQKLKMLATNPKDVTEWLFREAEAINCEKEREQASQLIDYYIGKHQQHMARIIEDNFPKTYESVLRSLEISNIRW